MQVILVDPVPVCAGGSGGDLTLRAALPLIKYAIRGLAVDIDFWHDNHWILDSTPVECGRSRPTAAVGRSHPPRAYARCHRAA